VTQHRPGPASLPVCAVLCGLLAAIGILAAPPAPAGPQAAPSSPAPSVATMPPAAMSDAELSGAAHHSAAPGGGGGHHPDPPSPDSADVRAAAQSRSDDLARSLVYSGLFGLAISITGLTMIVSRRRLW
jgi:hypothetical protein